MFRRREFPLIDSIHTSDETATNPPMSKLKFLRFVLPKKSAFVRTVFFISATEAGGKNETTRRSETL